MKILANDGISNEGKIALEKAGFTVITDKVDQQDLIAYVNANDVEMILVRSATTVRKEVIDACPNLKLIGRGGVGMDNIDVAYAREKGLTVINTPASSSQSVAELVMGHMFAGARSLHDSFKRLDPNNFNELKKKYAKGTELRGKTLLIIGFGRIGQSLATYAIGSGMKVLASNLHETEVKLNLEILQTGTSIEIPIKATTNLDELIPQADFISLHVPKQADGSAVLGKEQFGLMKKGVILLNAARGGVIDETALLDAIESGIVRYAGLDVFENEPNPMPELLQNENIGTTPHIGAATVEAQDRIGLELASLIINQFGVQITA